MIIDFVSFAALIATGSVTMSSITGLSRSSFAMSRDGLFPKWFAYVSKRFGTPFVAVTVSGIAIAVIASIFYDSLSIIASIFNFGILFTYILINFSLIKLRKKEPDAKRGFKVPFYPIVPISAILSSILLMYYLSDTAKIASAIWMVIGITLYIILIRKSNLKI
jgi:basic amino acid/polyamine antiporter, APA family